VVGFVIEGGHACNLLHTSDQANLMFKGCLITGRDQISGFQKVRHPSVEIRDVFLIAGLTARRQP
jgi:hypothetical protein